MRTLSHVFLCILLGWSLAGCGDGGNGGTDAGDDSGVFLCDLTEHLCPQGQRCNQDQECVEADPLRITTASLPDGRINFGYGEQIEAEGGLPPYTWAITQADPALEFLSINSRGILEGSTPQPVDSASITIQVTDDGYGGGETDSQEYTLSFAVCKEGDIELCYTPANGACYQGFRTCQNGQMSDCQAGTDTSSDRRHCGPDCSECDGSVSDGCVDGLCACGTAAVCTGTDRCCSGACMDVSDNIENCGGCGADCNQLVTHASAAVISCQDGVCDYTGDCDYGWLDCDSRRDNGCEQSAGVRENCGGCGVDCNTLVTHVRSSQKKCRDYSTYFECDYDGSCNNDFDDCDLDRSNGCETYLNEQLHCGACGVDCTQSAVGHLCLRLDITQPFECACTYNTAEGIAEGCDAGQICCENTCEDPVSNANHCGVCRAVCTIGGCVNAACGCAIATDCPSPSSATSCVGARCVCTHAGGGNAPCPAGEFCCDGQAGGSGGPGGDPDFGCCPKACSQNDATYACTP